MKVIPRVLLIVIFMAFAFPALATDFYTSSTGSDVSNNCKNISYPCNLSNGLHNEFDQVTAANGDFIYMCAGACDGSGSYIGDVVIDEGAGYWGHVPIGTSWSNAMTVMAYPGETITWKPSSSDWAIRICKSSTKYTIWKDFVLDGDLRNNFTDSGSAISVGDFVNGGCDHHRFENIEVKNWPGVGIYTYAQYNQFINMIVHDNGFSVEYPYPDGRGHGYYISSGKTATASSDYTLIDGGEVYNHYSPEHYNRYGIHLNHTTYPNSHITIRNVKVYHNTHGILPNGGTDINLYNNIVYENYYYGIRNWNTGTIGLYNNTVVGNGYYAIGLEGSSLNVTARNNVVWANANNSINVISGSLTQSNNLTSKDPLFVDQSKNNFHLNSMSPAIGTGMNLSSIFGMDKDANSRSSSNAWDIGAYGYVADDSKQPSPPTNLRLKGSQ